MSHESLSRDAPVHVIDDDEAVRDSLSFLLASAGLNVVAHESATAFLEILPQFSTETGCVITDVRMPGLSGIELLQRLKAMGVALPVIVITGHGDVPLAVEAMKTGAVDFFEKPFDDEALLSAVESALNLNERTVRRRLEQAEIEERLAALTTRERQVLDGLVVGQVNKTIAFDLGISPRTVEIYRANVMTKMQAASLSDLVRMALTAEIIPLNRESPHG
ncbi:response regulator FixJ [Pseudoxanthobacter sp.]|uniref:response regulator FixJ n=1 Tax=Pseudoxanthobacter sp. TaxID=1925742 RepID=UPI002FE1744F